METSRKSAKILVVDDELGLRELLHMELTTAGYVVLTAANAAEAMEHVKREKIDLMVTDFKMPETNGITLMEEVKKISPEIEVIMMTGYGTVESAVQAMKKGAYDFVLKPFNVEEMLALIEKCLERRHLKALVALYESSRAIFSAVKLEELAELVMTMLCEFFGADQGSLMLLNNDCRLVILASRGLDPEVVAATNLKLGERVSGRVAENREPVLLINGLDKYPEFQNVPSRTQIGSSIVCPLIYKGELLGVLNAQRQAGKDNFTSADLQSVTIFASQVALALQNAKLYDNLRQANKELESAQDKLIQSEKLASIGRLVAGVAHELNNPLTSVIGYSQLALESDTDPKEMRRQLSIIFDQAQRCNKIVKDLLLFSRRRKPTFKNFDLCRSVQEIVDGLGLEFEKKKVFIQSQYPTALNVDADEGLLKQAFANILTNAAQALEEMPTKREIKISIVPKGEKAQIVFADNGPGIPKDIVHKIFDPFFTTKDVGKGTGLGLSLSYGIIKEHGGEILVDSIRGKGTTFTLEIPLKQVEAPAVPASSLESQLGLDRAKHAPVLKRAMRVLIVEDEEPIQILLQSILDSYPFEFEIAPDGVDALEKIKNQHYDLILCDYRIPKLDGFRLYEEVKKVKPESLKSFIFISGSTQFMQNSEEFFKENNIPYLLKPFNRSELLALITKMTQIVLE